MEKGILKIKKGKESVIILGTISIVVIIFLATSFIYVVTLNSKLETELSQKKGLIDQNNYDLAQFEQDLTGQYKKLGDLNEENIRLYNEVIQSNTDLSDRDITITDRDQTITSLSDDLLALRQDIQEAKNRVDFPYPPFIIGDIEDINLTMFLRGFTGDDAYIYTGDDSYELTTVSELERFLVWDLTDEFLYMTRIFDCDDSASRLFGQISVPGWSGICFGMICSRSSPEGFHVFNVFITREEGDLVLYSVEPQNDRIELVVFLEDVRFIIFS